MKKRSQILMGLALIPLLCAVAALFFLPPHVIIQGNKAYTSLVLLISPLFALALGAMMIGLMKRAERMAPQAVHLLKLSYFSTLVSLGFFAFITFYTLYRTFMQVKG